MYQNACGTWAPGTSTTMRLGLPWVNFSSQAIGYGLGLGKSAAAWADCAPAIRQARETTVSAIGRDRNIGVILREASNACLGCVPSVDARRFCDCRAGDPQYSYAP